MGSGPRVSMLSINPSKIVDGEESKSPWIVFVEGAKVGVSV